MRVSSSFLFASSLALSPCQAASSDRSFETIWNILPIAEPADALVVSPGDMVWTQPLIPEQLVAIDADVTSAGNQRPILKAGARLIRARSSVPVLCQLDSHKADFGETMLIGRAAERTNCLVDTDGDGRLDSRFTDRVQFEGFPIIRGRYPSKLDPIVPVTYKPIAFDEVAANYRVGIEYNGGDLFRVAFAGPKDRSALSAWIVTRGRVYPQSLEIMGARFTVLSRQGPRVSVRIDRAFPYQPFVVMRHGR